ncbi:MAG: nucleotidyltransferase substrate binding protein [Chlorobi bacterium]|nr:nucleotidyltransferase substrate binding protein [Chlorobiota bacterium]
MNSISQHYKRWRQRTDQYSKALDQLRRFVERGKLNEFEQQGLIKAFEYTFELAWNALKDFLQAQGETNIRGSRDAIRLAFKRGLIENGAVWMEMVESRILTAHTYDEALAERVASDIVTKYYPQFIQLMKQFELLRAEDNE